MLASLWCLASSSRFLGGTTYHVYYSLDGQSDFFTINFKSKNGKLSDAHYLNEFYGTNASTGHDRCHWFFGAVDLKQVSAI